MSWSEYLASTEYQEFCEVMEESRVKFEKEAEDAWNSLDYEHQLRVFYAVVKRIHQAEIIDEGTYRWALYDVFNFGPEAYVLGMDCGFMELHNRIMSKEDYDKSFII